MTKADHRISFKIELKEKTNSLERVDSSIYFGGPGIPTNKVGEISYHFLKDIVHSNEWDRHAILRDEGHTIPEFCRLSLVKGDIRPEIKCIFEQSYNPSNIVFIDRVIIHKKYRSQGFGSLAIKSFIEEKVDEDNILALEACAFEASGLPGPESEKLCNWYESIGLIRLPGTNFMIFSKYFKKSESNFINTLADGERCLKRA